MREIRGKKQYYPRHKIVEYVRNYQHLYYQLVLFIGLCNQILQQLYPAPTFHVV